MPECRELVCHLERIVGKDHVVEDVVSVSNYPVDGLQPALVVSPGDPGQVSEVIKVAGRSGAGIVPWGGGTMMGRGNKPLAYDVALSLSRLTKVVDFDVANLTVTVQAGLTLSQLQEHLGKEKQFLPLDAPLPDRATVGGTVAANVNGPSRLAHGSVRDLVLGMRVALTNGEIIHVGGKTVKNVAGYDLCKVFIGSYGTLGVITEVTFRLLPWAQESKALWVSFADRAGAEKLVATILNSELLPLSLSILNQQALGWILDEASGPCVLFVGIAGSPETVERQVRQMTAMAEQAGARQVSTIEGARLTDWGTKVRDFGPLGHRLKMMGMAITANVPLSLAGQLLSEVEQKATELGLTVGYRVLAGTGTVNILVNGTERSRLVALYDEVVAAAGRASGHAVLDWAEPAVKEQVEVWGKPREDWRLVKALKQKFDPTNVLNRGRFVGGI